MSAEPVTDRGATTAATRRELSRRQRRTSGTSGSSGSSRGWGVVGVVGELFITLGVLLLLFVAWQLWWTDVVANRAADATRHALLNEFRSGRAPDAKVPGGLIEGKAFALIYIPRFGADYVRPILEGTDTASLQSGVGHYVGTAAPGAVGNFAVAGHRTTWGRPFHDIDTLVAGDAIIVETRSGYDVYAVSGHEIVAPTAVEVIAPVPDQRGVAPTQALLTMTACHPKYSAQQRYVVHAVLARTYTREEGLPASLLRSPSLGTPLPSGVASPSASPSGGG